MSGRMTGRHSFDVTHFGAKICDEKVFGGNDRSIEQHVGGKVTALLALTPIGNGCQGVSRHAVLFIGFGVIVFWTFLMRAQRLFLVKRFSECHVVDVDDVGAAPGIKFDVVIVRLT